MNLYQELHWRGFIYQETEGARQVLSDQERKITGYIGFDPTAESLHVGSLLPIMGLVHLQRYGHTAIAVVGGATGMIGDPSGKSKERILLSEEILRRNQDGIKKQLERFLSFTGKNPAIIVNNYDWTANVTIIQFLRDIGKNFTVNYMLSKESVKRRLDGEGISYTEFSYMLLQAFDFLHLYDNYNCILQMGGSDQWGNITAGIDLIRKLRGGKAYGLVFPLLTTASGTKFGKSEEGTIWLDEKLTSPYRFYQFWINADDRDVIRYLKFFTLLSKEEIESLEVELKERPERRVAHRRLAEEVTRMVHGEEGLKKAQRATSVLFGGSFEGLSSSELEEIFSHVPSFEISRDELEGMSIAELAVSSGLVKSKGEAKRLIVSGGLYMNNIKVDSAVEKVSSERFIDGKILVLRKGKKSFLIVKIR